MLKIRIKKKSETWSPTIAGVACLLAWVIYCASQALTVAPQRAFFAPVAIPIRPMVLEEPKFPFSGVVLHFSKRYEMDWKLVASVIKVESNFNPDAVSSKGAVGLMQVTPETAGLFIRKADSQDLKDPFLNVYIGTRYLKYLQIKYHGDLPLMLSAYNAGPSTVDLFGSVPPFPETRNYVRKVEVAFQRM